VILVGKLLSRSFDDADAGQELGGGSANNVLREMRGWRAEQRWQTLLAKRYPRRVTARVETTTKTQ